VVDLDGQVDGKKGGYKISEGNYLLSHIKGATHTHWDVIKSDDNHGIFFTAGSKITRQIKLKTLYYRVGFHIIHHPAKTAFSLFDLILVKGFFKNVSVHGNLLSVWVGLKHEGPIGNDWALIKVICQAGKYQIYCYIIRPDWVIVSSW
jgi:hypothetical protein